MFEKFLNSRAFTDIHAPVRRSIGRQSGEALNIYLHLHLS
jgi:hypothetical protein